MKEVLPFFHLPAFSPEYPGLKPDKNNKNNMSEIPQTQIEDFCNKLGRFLASNGVSIDADLNIQATDGRMTIITTTEVGNTRVLVWDNASEGQEVASWQE